MVNFLFLVDTSYIMKQKVPEYGLTLLDLIKTAIHRSVNNRRKSMPKPAENINSKFNHKYLLVTSKGVESGWDNSTDYFLKSVESLQPNNPPNFGESLSTAFRLFQSNPNHFLSYGQGWKSWQNEMNVLIILSYCINPNQSFVPDASSTLISKRNQIFNLNERNLIGDELDSDFIQWNHRIFVGNINVFGTLHITNNFMVRDALNSLCSDTSPSGMFYKFFYFFLMIDHNVQFDTQITLM